MFVEWRRLSDGLRENEHYNKIPRTLTKKWFCVLRDTNGLHILPFTFLDLAQVQHQKPGR